MPTLRELAEDTIAYLRPQPGFETIDRGDLIYVAGPKHATVHRSRLADVSEAVGWTRAESARRGLERIEWWVGWSATPAALGDELIGCGLAPDDPPVLTGMTCATAPPAVPEITVERIASAASYLEAIQVDWDVWEIDAAEQERRRAVEPRSFDQLEASGVVHCFSAFLDGRRAGFGRAVDLDDAAALMGGTVLPEARGCGVYRALVRARWEHAVSRGTPLLVVQAGELSTPILAGLGFVRHGPVRLYVDRL